MAVWRSVVERDQFDFRLSVGVTHPYISVSHFGVYQRMF